MTDYARILGRVTGCSIGSLDPALVAALVAPVPLPVVVPPSGFCVAMAQNSAQLAAAVIASRGIAVSPVEAVAIHAEVSAELERGHHE